MSVLPEHKEILLTQSESKTFPQWIEFFKSKYNKSYTRQELETFCYNRGIKCKHMSRAERGALQKGNQRGRKYHINQDYFKTWSHNMAYILGLWFADGCIYSEKIFDITLHNRDKYILKKIAKELEYEGNLQDYVDRQASRINFSCVVIYNDIVALGGTERKSLTTQFPEVPEEFLPDFIRGYFDGDGSAMRIKAGRLNTAFTCASKPFLDKLWKILKEKAGVEGGSYDKSCVSLKFGKRDSLKIGNYMYQNDPELFLLRKREKFY